MRLVPSRKKLQGDFIMLNPAQLRQKRSDLQTKSCLAEIATTGLAVTMLLATGAWMGSIADKNATRTSLLVLGGSMLAASVTTFSHNRIAKKLDRNWEDLQQAKREASKANNTRKCASCKYFNKESELLLGCAVNPSMPINCSDFENKNQVNFQDSSGLNVVVEGCDAEEVEEIKAIVNKVFSSEALPSP